MLAISIFYLCHNLRSTATKSLLYQSQTEQCGIDSSVSTKDRFIFTTNTGRSQSSTNYDPEFCLKSKNWIRFEKSV